MAEYRRQRQPPRQTSEPRTAGGEVARPDRVHRPGPNRAPDRVDRCGKWKGEADGGRLTECLHAEWRLEDRHRKHGHEDFSQRGPKQDPDEHPESHAQKRDLGGDRERPDCQYTRGQAKGQSDSDLTPLRLHDPGGQVERGESGPGKH